MKLPKLIAVTVVLVACTATVASFAGERLRYVRGTGLSGLGNPACGRDNTCCPICGCAQCAGHPWQVAPRDPRVGWGRGWGWSGHGHGHAAYIQPGPPTAAITYPYYTVRGPRDFLQRNPSPIGP